MTRAAVALLLDDVVDVRDAVHDACARVRLDCEPAKQCDGARLVIARLPPSERRVPDEVVEFVDRRAPDAHVLLLASEPLLRPTLALPGGRVTLMAPPHTTARLATRLQALLGSEEGWPLAGVAPYIAIRQVRGRGFWLGVFTSDPTLSEGDDGPRERPSIATNAHGGVTVAVTRGRSSAVDEARVARAAEVLVDATLGDDAIASEIRSGLGSDAFVVHLSHDRQEWVIVDGAAAAALWLFSPLRLPNAWNVRRSIPPSGLVRIPVERSDVLVVSTERVGAWPEATSSTSELSEVDAELAAAILDGGPSLLEAVGRRLGPSTAFSAAVVEVQG
jgi:hypothetical protein